MPTPRRWSLLVPLAGLAVAVLLLPLASAAWVPVEARPALAYLVVWVPLTVAVVGAGVLAARRTDERSPHVLIGSVSFTGVIVGAFVGLLLRCAAIGVEAVVTGRISGGGGLPGGAVEGAVLALTVIASVIVAPVIEETFFRGVLQPAVIERSGASGAAPAIGIVVAAALFAGVHALAGADLLGTAITFLAGIGFGVVARSSGLVPAVVAHVAFNASGLALAFGNAPVSPLGPTLGLG